MRPLFGRRVGKPGEGGEPGTWKGNGSGGKGSFEDVMVTTLQGLKKCPVYREARVKLDHGRMIWVLKGRSCTTKFDGEGGGDLERDQKARAL